MRVFVVLCSVYNAVYLEFLTTQHLAYKIATSVGLSPDRVSQILLRGPSGIHVVVSDSVGCDALACILYVDCKVI